MSKESFENKEGTDLKNSYQHYLELGGIINEKDYQSALDRMSKTHMLDREDPQVRTRIRRVSGIAGRMGIELNNSEDVLDPKIVLYVILRSDTHPKDVKYHYSQMNDEPIFGEVLRILGDADSLDKLIKAYPNISSKYKRGE